MLGLWMFGSELEQTWGTRRFTRFFFVCGIGAGIVMVVLFLLTGGDPRVSTIGASGAVYGVLLAFGILFPDRIIYWIIFPIPAKYLVMILGGIAFFSSSLTADSGVAHVAHLGGMLCGYVYMKTHGMVPRRHRRQRLRRRSRTGTANGNERECGASSTFITTGATATTRIRTMKNGGAGKTRAIPQL